MSPYTGEIYQIYTGDILFDKTCVYVGAIFLGHLQRSKHKGYLMPQALE
jgi:hypothetical protein